MFDIGFWEILLILVLALVVIGPERLPGAARKAGYWFGKIRRYIEGVRTEVESELDVNEFKRLLHNQEMQIRELRDQLQSGADDMRKEMPSSDFLTDVPAHSFHDQQSELQSGQQAVEPAGQQNDMLDADASESRAEPAGKSKAAASVAPAETPAPGRPADNDKNG